MTEKRFSYRFSPMLRRENLHFLQIFRQRSQFCTTEVHDGGTVLSSLFIRSEPVDGMCE